MSNIKPTLEQLEYILSVLSQARIIPSRYFYSGDLAVNSFMSGFHTACALFNVDMNGEDKIWIERGWTENTLAPRKQMENKGLSEEEMTVEILTVAILNLQREYNLSPQTVHDIHEEMRATNELLEQKLHDKSDTNIFNLNQKLNQSMKDHINYLSKIMVDLEQDMNLNKKDIK